MVLDVIQLGHPEGEGFEYTRMLEVDQQSGKVFVTGPSEKGALGFVDPEAGNAATRIDDAGLWMAGLAKMRHRAGLMPAGAASRTCWFRMAARVVRRGRNPAPVLGSGRKPSCPGRLQ